MRAILSALADLSPSPPPPVGDLILRREREQWGTRQDPEAIPVAGNLMLGLAEIDQLICERLAGHA